MMSNITKQWLKENLRDVQRLAETGSQVCKNILNARAHYNRSGDGRWLDNLKTNIQTYERWSLTVEGKAALENLRQPRPVHTERRGAQRNKTTRVNVARPAQHATKQSKSGRVIR